MYRIQIGKQPTKTLKKMSQKDSRRILAKLKVVAKDPYAPNKNVTKLQNRIGYRLRVGDWLIIYETENEELIVIVMKIAPRGEVYQ